MLQNKIQFTKKNLITKNHMQNLIIFENQQQMFFNRGLQIFISQGPQIP